MNPLSRIYVAGHRGLVGSALVRKLGEAGYGNLVLRSHSKLDLEVQADVDAFFAEERPEYVFLAAAKVGGIHANSIYPADFILNNLKIETNIIEAAFRRGVKALLFLGSSCIYPKFADQPIGEEQLLGGYLEPTNEAYAVAKIAGIVLCESFNRQHGTKFLSVMPTNLYGPGDNYDLTNSHVLPAFIRKFHLAKLAATGKWEAIEKDERIFGSIPPDLRANLAAISEHHGHRPPAAMTSTSPGAEPAVVLWGTGSPRREFMYSDDLAEACIFLMDRIDSLFTPSKEGHPTADIPSGELPRHLFNIGVGTDFTIFELGQTVAKILGCHEKIVWDKSKPDGTPRKLLDVSRLERLGWRARTPIAEGIVKAYQDYLQRSDC